MKNIKEFREKCAAYVLGALEKEEQEEFENFLKQADEEHLEILREYRQTASRLPLTVRRQPPTHLRQQVLDAVQKKSKFHSQQPKPERGRIGKIYRSIGLHKPRTALTTLAALLLLGFGLLVYSFLLHEQLGLQQEKVTELNDELSAVESYLSILESRRLEYVHLDGSGPYTAVFGKLICDLDRKRALLHMSNLPSLPEDKVYQLWVIKNGHAVNKGSVSNSQDHIPNFFLFEEFELEDASESEDIFFTITRESRPGTAEPSGDTMMSGSPVIL